MYLLRQWPWIHRDFVVGKFRGLLVLCHFCLRSSRDELNFFVSLQLFSQLSVFLFLAVLSLFACSCFFVACLPFLCHVSLEAGLSAKYWDPKET